MLESDTSFYYAMKFRKLNKDDYLDIPIQYQATVEMPSARGRVKFRKFCRSLECGQENRSRCNFGVDDKAEEGEEATVIEMIMKEPVSVEYELNYFETFTEVSPVSDIVKINLCAEFPVMVEYKIAKRGWFRLYLAPIPKDEDGPTEPRRASPAR
ncbi:hypothetical protein ACLB2K_071669 [Fragaria x ananassa]